MQKNIKVNSEKSAKTIIATLKKMGYAWRSNRVQWSTNYPIIIISSEKKEMWGDDHHNVEGGKQLFWPEDATEILSESIEIEIRNVAGHTAVISEAKIKVGCQFVSFEKFDEIAEAVKKVRGS